MLSEEEFIELCSKYKTHELTEAEYRKLRMWVDGSEENYRFFSNYVKLYKAEMRAETYRQADSSKGWQAIERKRRAYRLRQHLYRVAVAACLLTAVILGAFYFNSYDETPVVEKPVTLAEVFPDLPKNKVTLTLSSGQQIVLDKDSVQAISDNGLAIASGSNTSLNYQKVAANDVSVPQYNTVTVPEGSTFTLTLSDGTQVTLNSSSVFRYPVAFKGDRCVELIGEAYFDVTHDGTSFVVKVDNKEVEVLGTSFNVSGYSKKSMITTLVKGKVEVKSGGRRRLLLPGEQATVDDEKGVIDIASVDTELYTSWVSGKYDFTETPLSKILRQLELWYGVRIVYKDPQVRDLHFDGTVFRNKPLGFSLEIIRQVSDVRFDREDGIVFVSLHK